MKRILIFAFVFFSLEMWLFITFQDEIYKAYIMNDPYSYGCLKALQKEHVDAVRNIHIINEQQKPAFIISGGSTAKAFVAENKDTPRAKQANMYSIVTAAQKYLDVIRLMDNIDVPGSTFCLIINPRKFMDESPKDLLMLTRYLYGSSGSTPLNSDRLEQAYYLLKAKHHLEDAGLKLRLFRPGNVTVRHYREAMEACLDKLLSPHQAAEEDLNGSPKDTKRGSLLPPDHYKKVVARIDKWKEEKEPGFLISIEDNFILLNIIGDIAKEKGLTLIIVEAPYSDVMYDELKDYLALYHKKLNDFFKQYPEVKYRLYDYQEYKDNQRYFSDTIHLTLYARQTRFHDYLTGIFDYGR